MVGVFCLRPFRVLVKSDTLRFLSALTVLIVADNETRMFISFTYFSAFFVAILTALALVDDSEEVHWWAWFSPILMVSKPAVLAALPAMILVAMVSKSRFRLITLISLSLCVAQIIRLIISHSDGMFATSNQFSLYDKASASISYFFGLTGVYVGGVQVADQLYRPYWVGALIFLVCGIIIFKKKSSSNALILVGISLLFFSIFLNCFALSDSWNNKMALIRGDFSRHGIVAFHGIILVVVGLIATNKGRKRIYLNPAIFIAWFSISGWFIFARDHLNVQMDTPYANISQWQNMAFAIDSGKPVCVPIDPLGLMYYRNCSQLDGGGVFFWNISFYKALPILDEFSTYDVIPPTSSTDKNLQSMAVLIKPKILQSIYIHTIAIVQMNNGTVFKLEGGQKLTPAGGLIMLTSEIAIPFKDIRLVTLRFRCPIDLGFAHIGSRIAPAIFWMGGT